MYKKSENNENEVLVSINEKNTAFTSYCNLNVSYEYNNYKFCMCECDIEGCEGKYHKYTSVVYPDTQEEKITYLNEDALTVSDYKESCIVPIPASENDIMITTLADTILTLMDRITILEGGA